MNIAEIIICFFVLLWISVFLHEIGHAIMGLIGGYVITAIIIGSGKPLMAFNWFGIRIAICSEKMFRGITFPIYPYLYPSKLSNLLFYSGGVLVNFYLLMLGISLTLSPSNLKDIGIVLAVCNCLLLFNSIFPRNYSYNDMRLDNDGNNIIGLFISKKKKKISLTSNSLQYYTPKNDFLRNIGDYRGLYSSLIYTAYMHLAYLDIENVEKLLSEINQFEKYALPFQKCEATILKSSVAQQDRQYDEAETLLEQAEALYRDLHIENGIKLTKLRKINLIIDKEDMENAYQSIMAFEKELTSCPETLYKYYFIYRLIILANINNSEEAIELYNKYKSNQSLLFDTLNDMEIKYAISKMYIQQDKWEDAENFVDEYIQDLKIIYASYPDKHYRELFKTKSQKLIDNAFICYCKNERNQKAKQVKTFLSFFPWKT